MPGGRYRTLTFGGTRWCVPPLSFPSLSLLYSQHSDTLTCVDLSPSSLQFAQTLQQSRSFGSAFKFPDAADGEADAVGAAGNAAFQAENDEDDLYA